eukprot:9501665-Pyramimonas_sp.AAC.2
MDPPPRDAIVRSLELLYSLGALDDQGKISKVLFLCTILFLYIVSLLVAGAVVRARRAGS